VLMNQSRLRLVSVSFEESNVESNDLDNTVLYLENPDGSKEPVKSQSDGRGGGEGPACKGFLGKDCLKSGIKSPTIRTKDSEHSALPMLSQTGFSYNFLLDFFLKWRNFLPEVESSIATVKDDAEVLDSGFRCHDRCLDVRVDPGPDIELLRPHWLCDPNWPVKEFP